MLEVDNRLTAHILFWLMYYVYRVYLYIQFYEHTPLVQLIELPVKVGVAYLNLYLWMPYLLRRSRLVSYVLVLMASLLLGTFFQSEIIRLMIYGGIYDMPLSRLYTPPKFMGTLSHLLEALWTTTLIKIIKDAYLREQISQELQKERLEFELNYLKSQVNPHFFFNTLNNLYSLILLKSDQAEEVLLRLSGLMSYMLYETNRDQVSLQKEVEYLQDYIELEKLRFGDELNITFRFETDRQDYLIAPMLFLPFVENAFKHGAGNGPPAWIKIDLRINKGLVYFKVCNNLSEEKFTKTSANKGGIGLKNVRRRLDLLFGPNYTLKAEAHLSEKMFENELCLTLDKPKIPD
ncbi:MAG: histidine kinase [Microscillaceae bacterium]|nr:histidine kinase [Microscillaceae bacterium]